MKFTTYYWNEEYKEKLLVPGSFFLVCNDDGDSVSYRVYFHPSKISNELLKLRKNKTLADKVEIEGNQLFYILESISPKREIRVGEMTYKLFEKLSKKRDLPYFYKKAAREKAIELYELVLEKLDYEEEESSSLDFKNWEEKDDLEE
jgi:hypothetical protein